MDTYEIAKICIWAALGYTAGSIPFGFLLTYLAGLGDIRKVGSGNIGATNVLRSGGGMLAVSTLVLDGAKGMIPVWVASQYSGFYPSIVCALAAFLGHLYPVWLRFRGGKGVATYFGVLFAITWPIAAAACLVWLLTAALTRYSSLSAIVSSLLPPISFVAEGKNFTSAICLLMTLFLIARHRTNIKRLRNGEEPKLGQ